jgi:hypothetical protein
MTRCPKIRYVLCLTNEGYPASLEPRKVYRAILDPLGAKQGLVRIADESGEDYLYPKDMFAPVTLSPAIQKAIAAG